MTRLNLRLTRNQKIGGGALLLLWAAGAVAILARLFLGLGATTNMNDTTAWGIWIGFDVMSGVALAAGGFVIAASVYVFRKEKYRPILRPAILTALLGYMLVVLGLMLDIGQPWRIINPIFMRNTHSVLLEVAWCVILYTTVLALEFSPVVFERFKWTAPLKLIHKFTPILVIVGVILSTLHQSSLGSLFLIMPEKISPLWYTPLLPVLFYVTAIAVGLGMVIIESNLSSRAFKRGIEMGILRDLGWAAAWVLALYLVIRFADLAVRGALGLAFQPTFQTLMFWIEVGGGAILPMLLLRQESWRFSASGLWRCALLIVFGVVMYRLNMAITSFWMYTGNIYIPSLAEILVTLTLVTGGVVAFGVIARLFPVFLKEEQAHGAH
jgi:Ni/Fe-hydrogenase subunit HybB-like protein